eukprot:TRINITY_DN10601_c0_g1_i1.p1 TRINITY_DN10601_c0_g1~~TRINITY_DN10601_c0_g1_i1.p1  ORF type:complete len:123 (-),score=0.10 TRINITY_DN10601_c0_g1_i1:38-406(-)
MVQLENSGYSKEHILRDNRFIVEHAIESYLFISGNRLLFKVETPAWSVFHVNAWEEDLIPIRESFRARKNIEKFLNTGVPLSKMPWQVPPHAIYYGAKRKPFLSRLKVFFGRVKRDFKENFS